MTNLREACAELDRHFDVREGSVYEVVSGGFKRMPMFKRGLIDDTREWVVALGKQVLSRDANTASIHPLPYEGRRTCVVVRKVEIPMLDKDAAEAAGVDWKKANPNDLRQFVRKRVTLSIAY